MKVVKNPLTVEQKLRRALDLANMRSMEIKYIRAEQYRELDRVNRAAADRLDTARNALRRALSPVYRALLNAHDDAPNWKYHMANVVTNEAEPKGPAHETEDERHQRLSYARRVYCPLCHRGTLVGGYSAGFCWPIGLERHLTGQHNAQGCSVMKELAEQRIATATRTDHAAY